MANYVTIRGFAVTGVELHNTMTGLVLGNFRMGSTHRRPDPVTNVWTDGDTNWFRVNVFRTLAQNAVSSIHKGDRIIVVGKLHLNSYTRKDGTPAISVEIDAETVGPDLQFGTSFYQRLGAAKGLGMQVGSEQADDGGTSFPDSLASSEDPDGEHDADGVDDDVAAENDAGPGSEPEEAGGPGVNKETGEILKEDVPF